MGALRNVVDFLTYRAMSRETTHGSEDTDMMSTVSVYDNH